MREMLGVRNLRFALAIGAVLLAVLVACDTVEPAKVLSVSVEPKASSLQVGESVTLKVTVKVTGSAATTATWKSSNNAVATVDRAGKVTAVSAGVATITATSTADTNKSASAMITVTETDGVVSVTVDGGDFALSVGTSRTLAATVVVTGAASEDVKWSSSAPSVASVGEDSGEVTGLAVGTAVITATSTFDGSKSGAVTVTITEAPIPDAVVSVTVDDADFTLGVGASRVVTATVVVTGAASEDVKWSSSAPSVASVGEDSGEVTGLAVGTAVITATSTFDGSKSGSVTVTIRDHPAITAFTAAVVRGSQIEFNWTVSDADTLQLYAVAPDDDSVALGSQLPGSATSATVAIPDSGHQRLRLVATNSVGEAVMTLAPLANVVVDGAQDYDPYGNPAVDPVPGTLRQVIADAAPGSVIGFASDVDSVTVTGVELVSGVADAHLFLDKALTISGPATTRVTIEGASGYTGPDPDLAITFRSRVIYVASGSTVTLENVNIQGGEFIFLGGGVRNDGTLTLIDSAVRDNRAWNGGGGIYNGAGGNLTLQRTTVSQNRAFTTDAEIGTQYHIRGGPVAIPADPFEAEGYGGGIYNAGGIVTLEDSEISGNRTRFTGAGILNDPGGNITATGVLVANNHVDYQQFAPQPGDYSYGGGIYSGGTLQFMSGQFTENFAVDQGGGLYLGITGIATISGTSFSENEADWGGAIRHVYCAGNAGNLNLTNVSYSANVGHSGDPDLSASEEICLTAFGAASAPDSGKPAFLPDEVKRQLERR